MRKILFFQKKIKLLNVQFMVHSVSAQTPDNLKLVSYLFSETISKTIYTLVEIDNITRQATASKHVEILFRFMVLLFSGDFFRLTSLEILNSLVLKHTNGRYTKMIKIIKTIVLDMIVPFVEIALNVMWKMISNARRDSNLHLVTDVRWKIG